MRFIEYFVRYERLGDEIDVVNEIHDQSWLMYCGRCFDLDVPWSGESMLQILPKLDRALLVSRMEYGEVPRRCERVVLAQELTDGSESLESCGGLGVGLLLELDRRGIVQSETGGVEVNLSLRLPFEEVQPFIVKK